MNDYDVTVVGGAAAGLSAALVLARARRTVAVVDAGTPRNAPATHMHGFLSRDGFPPRSLLAAGQDEVKRYGGEIIADTVTASTRTDAGFRLHLARGRPLTARQLLIATGLRDQLPDIPGIAERWGIDLLHCPYCHGYEVRDQPVGVLGGTPEAVQHAQLVRQWSADIVFFPHTQELTSEQRHELTARSIDVEDETVARVVVDGGRLHGVELDDGRIIPRSAVFVRPRFVPNNDLLVALGCETDEHGWPVTDPPGRTSVPGVWVAGNVANPRGQVITAAGEGSSVAIAMNAAQVEDDVQSALRAFRRAASITPAG
jgi:thioredoxin reductase